MAYSTDFVDAAYRHKQAADCLHDCEPSCRRRDIAGYLYGIAAECALKEIMRSSVDWRAGKDRSGTKDPDERDPFRMHFPNIKTGIRDMTSGRHATKLQKFIGTGFMQEWDIAMRYSHKRHISEELVARWRVDAARVIEQMEDLR